MNSLRRNILKGAGSGSALAVAVAAGLVKPGQAFAEWNKSAFDAKNVADVMTGLSVNNAADSADIVIKAPDIAENGAVVPVEVTSTIPGTTSISIIAEKNGAPLIATYKFTGKTETYVSTRIKMGQTSLVRAVVTAGGKQYTAAKEVKVTIGGCGG